MGPSRFCPTARFLLGTLIIIVLIVNYRSYGQQSGTVSSHNMAKRDSFDPLDMLEVSLEQTSSSPTTVQVTVTNKNDHPVTVLSYDSPLDSMALRLGLLSITPAGQSQPLDLPVIQVRRMMPPPRKALIPIAAGGKATNEIVFKEKRGDLGSVNHASVVLSGRWHGVWAKEKESIAEIKLGGAETDPDVHTGTFSSNSLDITL